MEKVVIATTTRYEDKDETRAKLALATIKETVRCGHKIVVVDSSSNNVKSLFKNKGAIVIPQKEEGMGLGRRQAILEAYDLAGPDGFVAWVEPEKYSFIMFLEQIADYMKHHSLDLVIPERKSLASYPLYQEYFETIGRIAFSMLTGKDLDMWFGPRVFKGPIAHFFLNYKGEYGDLWDSIFVPVLHIIKTGKKVTGFIVDYEHPIEQTVLEENDFSFLEKRNEQLSTLIGALKKEAVKIKLFVP